MRNTLFWIALAALSLQDLFKKQSPTKRQQQFLQTGGTTQAFIAGIDDISFWKKKIKMIPKRIVEKDEDYFYVNLNKKDALDLWNTNSIELFEQYYDGTESLIMTEDELHESLDSVYLDVGVCPYYLSVLGYSQLFKLTKDDRYSKLVDIASSDWKLALQIAKGQGLI